MNFKKYIIHVIKLCCAKIKNINTVSCLEHKPLCLPEVFLCFQRVSKETIDMKWVNQFFKFDEVQYFMFYEICV